MRHLIFLAGLCCVLTSAQAQHAKPPALPDSLRREFSDAWNRFRTAIVEKDVPAVLALFTDSLRKHFTDYDSPNVPAFVHKRWVGDPYFVKAVQAYHTKELRRLGRASFEVEIRVSYPKQRGEEGDAAVVYFLDFRRYGKVYQLTDIKMAG